MISLVHRNNGNNQGFELVIQVVQSTLYLCSSYLFWHTTVKSTMDATGVFSSVYLTTSPSFPYESTNLFTHHL